MPLRFGAKKGLIIEGNIRAQIEEIKDVHMDVVHNMDLFDKKHVF